MATRMDSKRGNEARDEGHLAGAGGLGLGAPPTTSVQLGAGGGVQLLFLRGRCQGLPWRL